jgi:RNA polymerase sigma factor FliA
MKKDKTGLKLVEMVKDPYRFYYESDFKIEEIPSEIFSLMRNDENHLMKADRDNNFGFFGGYILGYCLRQRMGTNEAIESKPKNYTHLDPIKFCQEMQIYYDDLPETISTVNQKQKMLVERVQLGDNLSYRVYVGSLAYLSLPVVSSQDTKKMNLNELIRIYRITKDESYRLEFDIRTNDIVKYLLMNNHLKAIIASGKDIELLEEAGKRGIVEVFDRFDLTKPVQVETYLPYRVNGEIFDELRTLDKVPRSIRTCIKEILPLMQEAKNKGKELTLEQLVTLTNRSKNTVQHAIDFLNGIGDKEISLDKNIYDNDSNKEVSLIDTIGPSEKRLYGKRNIKLSSQKDGVSRIDNLDLLSYIISCLNQHEQEIIISYYIQGNTMKEIGTAQGYSESWISQEHTRIWEKLKKIGERMKNAWIEK